MVFKLYHGNLGGMSLRTSVVLTEMGIPFEWILVDVPNRETKSPEHLKRNPFGLLPVLDDDGLILFESRAIDRYVATKYRHYSEDTPQLMPNENDYVKRVMFERAASIELSNFEPAARKAGAATFGNVLRGNAIDAEAVQSALQSLKPTMDYYETLLRTQRYLAGDEVTLVDFFHLPTGYFLELVGINIMSSSERPNVARWWKEMTARSSWQSVTARFDEDLKHRFAEGKRALTAKA